MQKKLIAIAIIAVLALSACAGHGSYVQNETPAYWMKQYPGASQAKINHCMEKANAEYDKNVSDTAFSVGPILQKGNAWEACMESRS